MYKGSEHKAFEYIIIMVIVASSISLVRQRVSRLVPLRTIERFSFPRST